MNHKQIIEKIITNLSDDLLRKIFLENKKNDLAGHCYVASECFYHLLDDNEKQFWTPQILKVNGITHWFLKHNKNNKIIDVTSKQFDFDLNYNESKGCGFLTKNPSKRTKILINRVLSSN